MSIYRMRTRLWLAAGILFLLGIAISARTLLSYLERMHDGKSCTIGPITATEKIRYSTRPMTVSEFNRGWTLDVPGSAVNIQCADYFEWLAGKRFLKFEAPADECKVFAEAMLKAAFPTNAAAQQLRPLNVVSGIANPEPLSVPWFDPYRITRGIVGGGDDRPLIWVDLDRNVVYMQIAY